jgi:hypothetical protein
MARTGLFCQEDKPVAHPASKQASKPQARHCVPADPPRGRHYRRVVTKRRMEQARAIHTLGPNPLACLLTEIVLGGDPERHIEDFARAAERLVALAFSPPRGSA